MSHECGAAGHGHSRTTMEDFLDLVDSREASVDGGDSISIRNGLRIISPAVRSHVLIHLKASSKGKSRHLVGCRLKCLMLIHARRLGMYVHTYGVY